MYTKEGYRLHACELVKSIAKDYEVRVTEFDGRFIISIVFDPDNNIGVNMLLIEDEQARATDLVVVQVREMKRLLAKETKEK